MKKIFLIFLIILISCENEDSGLTNFSTNEYAKLFPVHFSYSNLELKNNKSIYIYGPRTGNNDFSMTLLNETGEIIWTKKHNINLICNFFFINEDLIYGYQSELNGIFKLIFDLNGNLISKENISNSINNSIYKQETNIYAINYIYSGINLDLKIEVIEFSLKGEKKRSSIFETNRIKGNEVRAFIKNNKIYCFGQDNCNIQFTSCSNTFCDIYNFSGEKINTFNYETQGKNISHASLILNNGNILMPIYNFNKSDYDFRLYSPEGNLIKSQNFNFNSININLFKNDMIGIAGGNNKAFSNNEKQSQFVIIDQNMEKIYEKKIGSFDNGETFNLVQEFDSFYYLIGNTDGTNGDFNIPNNTDGTDTFYIKLKK